jgi:hypothetical protein
LVNRVVSTVVAMTTGLLVLADFFYHANPIDALALYLIRTASVVAAFALILGAVNVLSVHLNKLARREKGWSYSIVLLVALCGTVAVGFLTDGPASNSMQMLFESVLFPLEATLFSLLAFFVVTAAFRAFRVKNFETGLFVVFGLIVLLGQVPVGAEVWPQFPIIKNWVLEVPALAGARGILLGVALGAIATGMRVLLGIDRPYASDRSPSTDR